MARIGLIGAGTIGTELAIQSRKKGLVVGPVVTTSGVYDLSQVEDWQFGDWKRDLSSYMRGHPEYAIERHGGYHGSLKETDAVFLAIPTRDNGEEACRYINGLLADGKPVVTCEKGALSLYFAELLEPLEKGRLGYSATVGGGTSLLKYMQERVRRGFAGRVDAIVNGTLNFTWDGVSSGRSLGEMITEAKMLGYAEPDAESPLDVVNTEAGRDVPRKATILFNTFLRAQGGEKFITSELVAPTVRRITPEMLRGLVRQAGSRRYIVSIRRPDSDDGDVIGGFSLDYDGWRLEGGFRWTSEDPLYQRLLTSGVDNAILIAEGPDESGGVYSLRGPGAGPSPTAAAMLRDLDDMMRTGIVKR